MKNGSTYFKYAVILIVALIVVYLSRCKFNCNGRGYSKTDTISVTRDTVIHKVDTVVSFVRVPYKTVVHDTLESEREVIKWETMPQILKDSYNDYNAKKFYKDSFDVNYGKLYLMDTLYKNRLLGSGFELKQSIPEITNTITIKSEPRVTLYAGINAMGNKTDPVYAVGGSLGIMAKNGKLYGGSYMLTKSGTPMYQGFIMIPIRLRKK